MNVNEKEKNFQSIKEIIENLTKDYGQGVVTTLNGSNSAHKNTISTGSMILDKAIGGGYVSGRIVEIYGQESSGKTTLALHAVKECQKAGKTVAYVDLENCLDVEYARKIGVKTKELLIIYPRYGEEALDITSKLVSSGKVNLIVIDSVAALMPKAELEADLEKQTIGLKARIMSSALTKINNSLTGKDSIIIFINQIRNKVVAYGDPETTTGGRALSYFASLRIKLKIKEKIEKGGEYVGVKTQAVIKKNKFSSPYKEPILEIMFGEGIKKQREVIDLAVDLSILQKNGSWYSYKDKKIGNGKDNVVEYLLSDEKMFQDIEKLVLERNNK
jgi:recombination protein RecA